MSKGNWKTISLGERLKDINLSTEGENEKLN